MRDPRKASGSRDGLNRREFLGALAAGAALWPLASCTSLAPGRGGRPNVVLLIADRLRADAVGFLGNDDVRTPRLDTLAAQGFAFTDALVVSPSGAPARAQILTGRVSRARRRDRPERAAQNRRRERRYADSPFFNRLPRRQQTLAEMLGEQGYATGFVGDWYVLPRRRGRDMLPWIAPGKGRQGFETWVMRRGAEGHLEVPYSLDSPRGEEVREVPKGFAAAFETDHALEFVRANQRRPFFLTVSWSAPRPPYEAPPEWDLYDPAALEVSRNVAVPFRDEARRDLAGYYAQISALDHEVGRIVDELERLGLAENTVLAFCSAHGDLLHSHRTLSGTYEPTGGPWSEISHVPLLFSQPGRISAGRSDALVATMDVAPTLLSLLPGAQTGVDFQGQDLAPLLLGEAFTEREEILLHMTASHGAARRAPWRALRTKDWWYAISADVTGEDWLLHDLVNDPLERRDLLRDPNSAGVKADLRFRMRERRKQLGDDLDLSSL